MEIRIVDDFKDGLENFVMSEGSIKGLDYRGSNKEMFYEDCLAGKLDGYRGKWVAYCNGHLIGEHTHRDLLKEKVNGYPAEIYFVIRNDIEY